MKQHKSYWASNIKKINELMNTFPRRKNMLPRELKIGNCEKCGKDKTEIHKGRFICMECYCKEWAEKDEKEQRNERDRTIKGVDD